MFKRKKNLYLLLIKRGVLMVIAISFINCGFSQSSRGESEDSAEYLPDSPPLVESKKKIMPLDWSVSTLSGEELVLSNRFPNQVLFINIWATWCAPCIREMPSIEKLYLQFKDRVAFVCVSQENQKVVARFAKKRNYDMPLYYKNENLPADFRTHGIPTTFIIATNGELAYRHLGAADWNNESVIAFLNKLLHNR